MSRLRLSREFLIGILIVAFFAIALLIRIYLPYGQVFVGDWIKFTGNDAYYQMRLVDTLVHNFPHLGHFDPYLIFPGGGSIGGIYFFNWLLAAIIWVVGLGHPTQHLIDVISVYYPVVLAALTVVPVYFIGKALFNRWAGVLAAGLVAILPGEFLGRTILGFADLPPAEVLFSAVAILFLILAIKSAGERQLTLSGLRRDFKAAVRPLVMSLLAGLFLGIYLITWIGAPLFVFIILLYFVFQFVINHLRGSPSEHLGIVGFIMFLVALVIFVPFGPGTDLSVGMCLALLVPPVLAVISRLMAGRRLQLVFYPVGLVALGAVAAAVLYGAAPGVFHGMMDKFAFVFYPTGATATTTQEMAHFPTSGDIFSPVAAWGQYTTSFFLTKSWAIPGFALISFGILAWLYTRQRRDGERRLGLRIANLVIMVAMLWLLYGVINAFSPVLLAFFLLCLLAFIVTLVWLASGRLEDSEDIMLLFIWTLVIGAATMVQRRFNYYLVVNIALLSGYISWQIIWQTGLKKLAARAQEALKEVVAKSKAKKKARVGGVTIYHFNVVMAVIVVFFFVFFWNIATSRAVATQAPYAPSDAWQSSLEWLRDNSPEPLGDAGAYYDAYPSDYLYPASAYGVTAWWDYGYWITRIAHRIPSDNPSQSPGPITNVAKLFLSENDAETREMVATLKSSYFIGDYDIATSKFYAVGTWAGEDRSKYYGEYYYEYETGKLVQVQVIYPDYYRTLLVRLYCFDGKAVTDVAPVVITIEEKTATNGNTYKVITDIQDFPTYQQALDFVAAQGAENHVIIGLNPFTSPVPLDAVTDYELVHSSDQTGSASDNTTIPLVKIFKYIGS